MIILERPYVSEFLLETIIQNDIAVLQNDVVQHAEIEEGALKLIATEQAKNHYLAQEFPLIYSNSENSISWVLENLPQSNLSEYIRLFKDKAAFRDLLKELYPDFYYKVVEFSELVNLKPKEIKYPVVIKPTIGFLSFGVHTIKDSNEWNNTITKLANEMTLAETMYPKNVIDSSKFIIEELIQGEEFAIDAYYDRNGEPVILNIFQHPFYNDKDVSDRIYLVSTGIMIKYMAKLGQLLREIGHLKNIRNFPMHIEVRINKDGEIIPIEVNPMRFAGWCTTDLAKYAWGINVYEYFFKQLKPDWNNILEKSGKGVYYFSMAEVPQEIDKSKIKHFDYNKYLSNFTEILELRRINYMENPLFAVIFGKTDSKEEVLKILSLKTREYITT